MTAPAKRRRTTTNKSEPCVSIEPTSIEDCIGSHRLAHNAAYHQFTSESDRQRVQKALLTWFDAKQRTNMPWRKPARLDMTKEELAQRAYEVWVSEIMLQQTQVATVIGYYERWMASFPTIYDLASADLEQVNTLWAGLGYYSRAKRLWEGAKKVVQELEGCLPNNAADLEKQIPGVGPYTAGAVASIVFGQQTPLVDGNVIRVLARLRAIRADMKKSNVVDLFWKLAGALVPKERPGDFNQALMELGATVCTPANPACDACPVQSDCHALNQWHLHGRLTEQGFWNKKTPQDESEHECEFCPAIDHDLEHEEYAVTRYPVKSEKKPPRDEECSVAIVEKVLKDGSSIYLISKRPEQGLLAGLWEFPSVELAIHKKKSIYAARSKQNAEYLKQRYQLDLADLDAACQDLDHVVHLFSHIRKVYYIEWVRITSTEQEPSLSQHDGHPSESKWIPEADLKTAPIPTGLKKALKLLDKAKSVKHSSAKRRQPTSKTTPSNTNASITSFFTKKETS
ncbi:DNA glycosylase [Hesseltinella vesiculosa]|uniref:Adenine DNA glycosylase n=1 Tax=Hesseltinella vesiculosa TaxID=101127 RepID=A0A1X2GSM3_9FUNG|nr:DNA glycosylase [Hesseltinella vesiculosa]